MNLLNYLDKNSIILGLKQKSKKSILADILGHLVEKNKIAQADKKEILKALLQREEMGSTAIGNHIAFPHARISKVKDFIVCVGISKEGINFDSLDQEPVNIIALLLYSETESGLHLKMLAFLAKMLRDKYLIQGLRNVKNETDVIDLLNKQQQVIR